MPATARALGIAEIRDLILSYIPCHNCLLVNRDFYNSAVRKIWHAPEAYLEDIEDSPLVHIGRTHTIGTQDYGRDFPNIHTLHIIGHDPLILFHGCSPRKIIVTPDYKVWNRTERYTTTALLEDILDFYEPQEVVFTELTRVFRGDFERFCTLTKVSGEFHVLAESDPDPHRSACGMFVEANVILP